MKFASRSDIASLSSANWGSRMSRGFVVVLASWVVLLRRDARDDARRGVVGREGRRVRDGERWRAWLWEGGVVDMML